MYASHLCSSGSNVPPPRRSPTPLTPDTCAEAKTCAALGSKAIEARDFLLAMACSCSSDDETIERFAWTCSAATAEKGLTSRAYSNHLNACTHGSTRGCLQALSYQDMVPLGRHRHRVYPFLLARCGEGGMPRSCKMLAWMYATGTHVPKDEERAQFFWDKACLHGYDKSLWDRSSCGQRPPFGAHKTPTSSDNRLRPRLGEERSPFSRSCETCVSAAPRDQNCADMAFAQNTRRVAFKPPNSSNSRNERATWRR